MDPRIKAELLRQFSIRRNLIEMQATRETMRIPDETIVGVDASLQKLITIDPEGNVRTPKTLSNATAGTGVKVLPKGGTTGTFKPTRVPVIELEPEFVPDPIPLTGIPILFTRLNDDGDREFWLGGDRTTPILLDTFPKLSLNINPWEQSGGITYPASPTFSANISGTSTALQVTSSLDGLLNLPLYLLTRVTGRLEAGAGQSATAGYLAANRLSGGTDLIVEATESTITTTLTTGDVITIQNRGSVELIPPTAFADQVADFRITRELVFSGTSSVDATIEFEFIPCYLTATSTTRYVLLQPEIGTLKYYEIDAQSGSVTSASYTTDPIETSTDDWRREIATFTYPFTVTNPCYAEFDLEYGPYTSTYENIGAFWASNFADGKLYRMDSRQGLEREKLFYTGDQEPLVLSEDVELDVTVYDAEASGFSCSLTNETTATVTARSLNTPDALILAIAPVVVE